MNHRVEESKKVFGHLQGTLPLLCYLRECCVCVLMRITKMGSFIVLMFGRCFAGPISKGADLILNVELVVIWMVVYRVVLIPLSSLNNKNTH